MSAFRVKPRVSKNRRLALWKEQHGRCALCGTKVKKSEATTDHIVPVFWGGTNRRINLQMTCEACNQQKGAELAAARACSRLMPQRRKRKTGNTVSGKMLLRSITFVAVVDGKPTEAVRMFYNVLPDDGPTREPRRRWQ